MSRGETGSQDPPSVTPTTLLAGVLVGAVLFSVMAHEERDFDPAMLGIGLDAYQVRTFHRGRQISDISELSVVKPVLGELRREGRPAALWMGASQLYAVNNLAGGGTSVITEVRDGPEDIAFKYATLAAEARGSQLSYLGVATPNASLHDLLAYYLSFRHEGLLPEWLVVGFVYDDLAETELQAKTLIGLPPITPAMIEEGGDALRHLAAFQEREARGASAAPVERSATSDTPQEWLETSLVERIERYWPPYAARDKLRSALYVRYRYFVQFSLASVVGYKTVIVPKDNVEYNLEALDALLRLTKNDGVELLVYKAPHRPSEGRFYHDRAAYDGAAAQVKKRCEEQGAVWVDLELIVPQEFWGLTAERQPDVFHFRSAGHQLLGRAVDEVIAGRGDVVQ